MRQSHRIQLLQVARSFERTALIGAPWKKKFDSFVKEFGKLAVASGDKMLMRFANRLLIYPDYMTDVDPVEFAQHLLRNAQRKKQAPSYRTNAKPLPLGHEIARLLNYVRQALYKAGEKLQEPVSGDLLKYLTRKRLPYDNDFVSFAGDFLQDAANSLVPSSKLWRDIAKLEPGTYQAKEDL